MKTIKKVFDLRVLLVLAVVGLVAVLGIVGNRLQQATPPVLPAGTPGLSLYSALDEARRLLRENNPEAAARVLETFVSGATEPVELYQANLVLAETYTAYGDFNKALGTYQDLAKYNQPESFNVMLATAQAARAVREYSLAEETFKKAQAALPADAPDDLRQFIDTSLTEVAEARQKLQFSETVTSAVARAEIAERFGDRDGAIRYYEQAITAIDTSKPEGLGYQRFLTKTLNKLKGIS